MNRDELDIPDVKLYWIKEADEALTKPDTLTLKDLFERNVQKSILLSKCKSSRRHFDG